MKIRDRPGGFENKSWIWSRDEDGGVTRNGREGGHPIWRKRYIVVIGRIIQWLPCEMRIKDLCEAKGCLRVASSSKLIRFVYYYVVYFGTDLRY
jgi:hypothetical protein